SHLIVSSGGGLLRPVIGTGRVRATRPAPGGIVRRVAEGIPAGACGRLGVSCGLPEPSWRDADAALEVLGELALIREADVRGDLCQREVRPGFQELLDALDAAGDDVLVGQYLYS